jgi:hypothetical protein
VLSLGSLHISPVHTVADRGLDAQPIFLLLPGSVLIFVCWAWVYSFSFTLQTFIIPYPFLPILILKIDKQVRRTFPQPVSTGFVSRPPVYEISQNKSIMW